MRKGAGHAGSQVKDWIEERAEKRQIPAEADEDGMAAPVDSDLFSFLDGAGEEDSSLSGPPPAAAGIAGAGEGEDQEEGGLPDPP